jgi:membrane fusion protein (multidrug efflux system)
MNISKQLIGLVSILLTVSVLVPSCKNESQNQQQPQEITVVKVLKKDVPIYQEFVGQVYGSSDIPIRARVSGFLESIDFNEGTSVKKGQLLYTIDPLSFQAKVAVEKSGLAEANTSLAKAESDLNRIKPLAEINAVSKSDLDAAQAQYDATKAMVTAAKSSLEIAKIDLSYCWVKSPINGLIGKTKAKVGEFVGQNPNPVILNTVSLTDSVLVEIFITEADFISLFRRFAEQSDREIEEYDERNDNSDISLILADGSTFKYKGQVNFIDRSIDPTTGSLLVQTVFPNPDKLLRPGLYGKVKIRMSIEENALLIPQRCVTELQGQFSVFIVNSENKVESKQIITGEKVGDYWLIEKGLEPGDKVVIDAIQKVRSEMVVIPKLIEFESKFNNMQNK